MFPFKIFTSFEFNIYHYFFQQAPPGFESVFCSCSCEETQKMEKAVAHCEDCKENLCETCYQAHIRVRITKEHRITWLHGKNPLLNSGKKNLRNCTFENKISWNLHELFVARNTFTKKKSLIEIMCTNFDILQVYEFLKFNM